MIKKTHTILSAVHCERRAGAPGALRAEIMLSCARVFLRLNVPKPLASSEIYPRVKILLWSQEIKQWNRLPLHPFLFFFLWPNYCCLTFYLSYLNYSLRECEGTHESRINCESRQLNGCLYQLHLVLPLQIESLHSVQTEFTHVREGKWAHGLFTRFFTAIWAGKKNLITHHIQ